MSCASSLPSLPPPMPYSAPITPLTISRLKAAYLEIATSSLRTSMPLSPAMCVFEQKGSGDCSLASGMHEPESLPRGINCAPGR